MAEASRQEAVDFLQRQEDFLKQDLGEPETDRGVPLKESESEREAEPGKLTEEIAEGQDSQEEVSDEKDESTQAEGQPQKLRAKQFAEQAGWTLEEFYRDVIVPTDEGDATLSEVVDGYKSLRAENESLRQERQELEAKATQTGLPMQQYSPEAVDLLKQAELYQKQYDEYDWSQVDATEAINLKMQYKDAIDKLQRAAQAKQQEYGQKVETQMREYFTEMDTQIKRDIPEWRNQGLRTTETDAILNMARNDYGFDSQRLQAMKMDPPSLRVLRDLWNLKKTQAEVRKAVKKVQKIPKSLQPGARQEGGRKPNAAEIGKRLKNASRREFDRLIQEAEFDDALLKR